MSEAARFLNEATAAYDDQAWGSQERLARKALEAALREGDRRTQARAFHHLGIALYHRNAADDSRAAYNRALTLFEELGDAHSKAVIEMSLGSVALDLDADAAKARAHYDLALPVLRESGDAHRLAQCLGNIAEIRRMEGEFSEALAFASESLELFQSCGDIDRVGWQHVTIANCHTLQRHYPQAARSLEIAYAMFEQRERPTWMTSYFEALLMLAVNLRKWDQAAQLSGFLERYRHENAVPRLAGPAAWYKVSTEQIERNLPDERIFELRMQGADLAAEQAHALSAAIT